MSILSGCESAQEQQQAQNKFLVIEQQENGKYVVIEEMPTEGPSRAIIRERDEFGNIKERFMNEEGDACPCRARIQKKCKRVRARRCKAAIRVQGWVWEELFWQRRREL